MGVGRTEWVAMQASADSMRGLVRIKIADDNDIKEGRSALTTLALPAPLILLLPLNPDP